MKYKLYIFTLEPIEQRYTKQWYNMWKKEFSHYFDVEYIDGPEMSDTIEKGKFLDINKTNLWKAVQVEKLSKLFIKGKIKNGDKFIFMDAWHFGITALKYMIDLQKFDKCKLYGYWHAGSYDSYDFIAQAGLGKWCNFNEQGWAYALDINFVSTEFHKKLLRKAIYDLRSDKIKVVGFPMDWYAEIEKEIGLTEKQINEQMKTRIGKEYIITFPHRLDKEKNPQVFDEMKKQINGFDFIKTFEVTKNKSDYYKLLNKGIIAFSASDQETFGIGIVEALMLGEFILVPDKLSYSELYKDDFKYRNKTDAINKFKHIQDAISLYEKDIDKKPYEILYALWHLDKDKIKKQSLNSIKCMARLMLE